MREADGGRIAAPAAAGPAHPEGDADAADVAACQAGDVERFAGLVRRHQDRVYGLALRFCGRPADAADLAQEAFVRAFAALGRFDPRRPFGPWLLRIAVNACRDAHRRQSLRPPAPEGAWERLPDPEPGPEEAAEAHQRRRAVRRAVAELAPEYRLLLALAYDRGLSLGEVAAATGLPLSMVKNRLFRARRRLAERLAAYGPEGRQGR